MCWIGCTCLNQEFTLSHHNLLLQLHLLDRELARNLSNLFNQMVKVAIMVLHLPKDLSVQKENQQNKGVLVIKCKISQNQINLWLLHQILFVKSVHELDMLH